MQRAISQPYSRLCVTIRDRRAPNFLRPLMSLLAAVPLAGRGITLILRGAGPTGALHLTGTITGTAHHMPELVPRCRRGLANEFQQRQANGAGRVHFQHRGSVVECRRRRSRQRHRYRGQQRLAAVPRAAVLLLAQPERLVLMWQPCRWSFTSPMACMNAYIVVGPTNVQPRRRRSFESAVDSGLVAIVFRTAQVSFFGRDFAAGSNRQ